MSLEKTHAGELDIDISVVARLIAEQFPHWAHLPVRPIEPSGWDNRTFRLGNELAVRLPSADWYALQVDKEQRWLPILASRLPLPIPTPVARGVPGEGYPYSWSVLRWLEGEPASVEAIGALGSRIPHQAALAVWDDAMDATWRAEPVWFHGDVAAGNLLVRDGRLAAVIDFGNAGVGDPACDIVIAWTLLSADSRRAFRAALAVDPATWARGRGWALWKSLITLRGNLDRDPEAAAVSQHVIGQVLADHADV
jgi:aminoglycoside phosphotransferase (APT) family kinase protein